MVKETEKKHKYKFPTPNMFKSGLKEGWTFSCLSLQCQQCVHINAEIGQPDNGACPINFSSFDARNRWHARAWLIAKERKQENTSENNNGSSIWDNFSCHFFPL